MRKMPIATTLATLALLAGTTVQAEAQKRQFEALDSDANGYISEQEAAANPDLYARWKELDGDKNNLLDISEFSAFEPGSGETMRGDGMMKKDDMMDKGGMMEQGGRME